MLGDEVGSRLLDVLEHCRHVLPRIADSVRDTVSLLILRVLDLLSRNKGYGTFDLWRLNVLARGHSSRADNCDRNLNALICRHQVFHSDFIKFKLYNSLCFQTFFRRD